MIRIIICDDDVPFAEYLERQVKEIFTDLKNETDIRSFTSPEECLKYVTRDGADTDVVFLDIDMPGTTGFDIAKEIKKERRVIHEEDAPFSVTDCFFRCLFCFCSTECE